MAAVRDCLESTTPEMDSSRPRLALNRKGFFSYDKAAKKLILRQLHVEGFVNHVRRYTFFGFM